MTSEVKKFTIIKSFSKANIHKSEDENSQWLGKVKMVIATTHPDRQGDYISKGFIRKIRDDLKQNTTAFYNHLTQNRSDLPIGKTLASQLVDLEDGHQGVEIEIGISKTAPDIWTLVQEGVLNKGSIGGDIYDLEYDDHKDLFKLNDGVVYEPSIVGIPANPQAEIGQVLKTLRKSIGETRKVNNKHIESEFDMDEEALEKLLNKAVGSAVSEVSKRFETQIENTDKDTEGKISDLQKAFNDEKDKLKKELELAREKEAERQAEIEDLKKSVGSRQSERQNIENLEAELYKDKDFAMAKGLQEFGRFLADSREGDVIMLEGSLGNEGLDREV